MRVRSGYAREKGGGSSTQGSRSALRRSKDNIGRGYTLIGLKNHLPPQNKPNLVLH